MSDVVLAALAVALMVFHVAQARSWSAERARLVSAALAPTPSAAAAALVAPVRAAKPADRDERPPTLRAVGDG